MSKTLLIRERFSHMGAHSGYDQVCCAISSLKPESITSVWRNSHKSLPKGSRRFLTQIAKDIKVSPFYDSSSTATELVALWKCLVQRQQLIHITYVENNLGILPRFRKNIPLKIIGTVHQPTSWWRLIHPYSKGIEELDALIVLSKQEMRYFEQFLPGSVYFVPHGVDVQFFSPRSDLEAERNAKCPRCVFAGTWLRDLDTLEQIIEKVISRNSRIHFDIIVPRSKRNIPVFYKMARHDQVHWYADLSDEQLRQIYQNASVFLLPLLDSTANNALLEAIACGLPVVSNSIGGILDYTQPAFATLLPPGDVDGFTEAILHLVDDYKMRQNMGQAARLFAEKHLAWEYIVQQTLEVYKQVYSAG